VSALLRCTRSRSGYEIKIQGRDLSRHIFGPIKIRPTCMRRSPCRSARACSTQRGLPYVHVGRDLSRHILVGLKSDLQELGRASDMHQRWLAAAAACGVILLAGCGKKDEAPTSSLQADQIDASSDMSTPSSDVSHTRSQIDAAPVSID